MVTLTFILIRETKELPKVAKQYDEHISLMKLLIYIALFIFNILTVVGVVHYLVSLLVTMVVMMIMDRRAFLKVDYNLLLTFVFFFILIGNIGRMEAVTGTLSGLVSRNPVPAAILSSQIISNVPAAMLLSAFTKDGKALIIGTNLGGLGTLIASMASLITYRFHASFSKNNKDNGNGIQENYILNFTWINVAALLLLFGLYLLLSLKH